jgi:photosystem II stability/assembly factor-like uncharacterized protein
VQLLSRSFGVAAVLHCRAPNEACHDHLVATEDMGRTWTDITPESLPKGISIYSVFFLDRQHGWTIAGSCEPSEATIFHTVDGGRSWRGSPTDAPDCHAGSSVRPEFVDPLNGWIIRESFVGESTSLRRTTDGGNSWTKAMELEHVGDVGFTDASRGWQTTFDTAGLPRLLRSSDAGRTWKPVDVPAPACCEGLHESLSLPVFSDADHGVLPIVWQRGERSLLDFATTDDGGSTWQITGSIGPPDLRADVGYPALVPIAIASPIAWWVATPKPPSIFTTDDGGTTWHQVSVPGVKRITWIDAIDEQRAWVTGNRGGRGSTLFETRDGGRSWRVLDSIAAPAHPATSVEIRNVLSLDGAVTALTVGPGGILYAASFANHASGGTQQRVVRFDPSTGATAESPSIGGAQGSVDRLAFVGDSVWVAAGNPRRHPKSDRLYELDGATLAIRRRLTMAAPPTALASVPAGLWVAAGKRLELMDPWTSAVIRVVTLRGHVRQLAASPDGSLLYVATDAPVRRDASPLLELDSRTGVELARSWQGFADLAGVTGLTSTQDGVWVTFPTGTMASLRLLRTSDLRRMALYRPESSNALRVYAAGAGLWVENLLGGYTCADPSTEIVRGYVGIRGSAHGTSNVVATPEGIFVGAGDGIDRIVPSTACLAP